MLETILHTYRHLSSSYGDKFPDYTYRQLVLANKYPNLADRHPHVVPGVAIFRARESAERWVRENMTLTIDPIIRIWCDCWARLGGIALVAGIMYPSYRELVRKIYPYPDFLLAIPDLIFAIFEALLGPLMPVTIVAIVDTVLTHFKRRSLVDRLCPRLPSMAGRVAQVAKAVQLVTQRAFQAVTCKARVMASRYW
jgi:hypothetical protein